MWLVENIPLIHTRLTIHHQVIHSPIPFPLDNRRTCIIYFTHDLETLVLCSCCNLSRLSTLSTGLLLLLLDL